MKIKILSYHEKNPWKNLAIEEFLLRKCNEDEIILYLWQNENTVVIGKHQNIWKECNVVEIQNNNCKIARRITGGGAVYHDTGNLNFSFIADKKIYNQDKQFSIIIDAIKRAGIDAELSGRNDILVDGMKISGNAFYKNDKFALHHGTILVDADLDKLSRYLRPSKLKMKAKGVKSVKSRVTNLSSFAKINVDLMNGNLIDSFKKSYGSILCQGIDMNSILNDKMYNDLYKRNKSWEWNFDKTGDFDVSFESYFSWGYLDIAFKAVGGVITTTYINTDALDVTYFSNFEKNMLKCRFNKTDIIKRVNETVNDSSQKIIAADIENWIKSLSF